MYEFGVMPTVHDLDKLLYSLCRRKHVKLAEHVFDNVKNSFLLSAKEYNILISG